MSLASDPRRVNGAEGDVDFVSVAQSRGECPGDKMTLREGRDGAGSVDVVGARDDCGCMWVLARTFCAGTRREEADEGGGRSAVPLLFD